MTSFDDNIAKKAGLKEAVIYELVKKWDDITIYELNDMCPYLNYVKIRHGVKKLESLGLIENKKIGNKNYYKVKKENKL